jgi:hypothetical protein
MPAARGLGTADVPAAPWPRCAPVAWSFVELRGRVHSEAAARSRTRLGGVMFELVHNVRGWRT